MCVVEGSEGHPSLCVCLFLWHLNTMQVVSLLFIHLSLALDPLSFHSPPPGTHSLSLTSNRGASLLDSSLRTQLCPKHTHNSQVILWRQVASSLTHATQPPHPTPIPKPTPPKRHMNNPSAFVKRVSWEVHSRQAAWITELVVSVRGGVFPEDNKRTPSPYPYNPSSPVVPEVELFSRPPRPSFYEQPCMKDQLFVRQLDN